MTENVAGIFHYFTESIFRTSVHVQYSDFTP